MFYKIFYQKKKKALFKTSEQSFSSENEILNVMGDEGLFSETYTEDTGKVKGNVKNAKPERHCFTPSSFISFY